ncbi:DUF1214 domain-containing protein [Nocardia sp. NPDC056952]|uniref:DUF1214 domain-containing protein n=1 Tax=Nocardia sp. NPDC056952 TaxID=3345979 RepID=UPI0036380724
MVTGALRRHTRCLLDNGGFASLASDQNVVTGPDGSAQLYFGPEPPASGEQNWIKTVPGRGGGSRRCVCTDPPRTHLAFGDLGGRVRTRRLAATTRIPVLKINIVDSRGVTALT